MLLEGRLRPRKVRNDPGNKYELFSCCISEKNFESSQLYFMTQNAFTEDRWCSKNRRCLRHSHIAFWFLRKIINCSKDRDIICSRVDHTPNGQSANPENSGLVRLVGARTLLTNPLRRCHAAGCFEMLNNRKTACLSLYLFVLFVRSIVCAPRFVNLTAINFLIERLTELCDESAVLIQSCDCNLLTMCYIYRPTVYCFIGVEQGLLIDVALRNPFH